MKRIKLEENKNNSQHRDKSISKSPGPSYARKSRMSNAEITNIYTGQNSPRFNSNLRSPYLTPRRSERHSRQNSRYDLEEEKGSKNASPSSRKSPSSKRSKCDQSNLRLPDVNKSRSSIVSSSSSSRRLKSATKYKY